MNSNDDATPSGTVTLTAEEAALIRIRLREIDDILARHGAYLPGSERAPQ